ncbi:MAG: UDP-4-amino-4,6-dideoxy-N-acetyl-beta-L-altrosamine transaminase [Alphaproteobacteria bacterium]
MTIKYPYSRPWLSENDITAVHQVLGEQFLTQGPQVGAFEREFAAAMGAPEAVVCSSGTAALHLAYLAAGLGPERGLLTSPITFLATANAAIMCGAPVVFADVEPATGLLDPDSVRAALRDTKTPIGAIAPVHLGGRACDMVALRAIADEFGCLLIEDACHAPGAVYRDEAGSAHRVGACAHGDMAVFSFHAIKHIATGEGGAVCTRDAAWAERMRRLGSHGIIAGPEGWTDPPEPNAPWYYEMQEIGYNYRLTDIQCALGRAQLAGLPESLARRRHIARLYYQLLDGLPHLAPPPRPAHEDEHAWHLFPVAVDFAGLGKTRGEIMPALAGRGVGTQVHYIPLTHQPFYKSRGQAKLAGAEDYYARTLSIPMYAGLEDEDVAAIASAIGDVLRG